MIGQNAPRGGAKPQFVVFRPDAARLSELGFGKVAHVPVLFDAEHVYCRAQNRYLRERARCQWHPSWLTEGGGRNVDYPRPLTLKRMADCLANFGAWLAQSGRDWRTVTYDDVLTYQQDQIDGRWSRRGPLKVSTANGRADEATHFLQWAAATSLREPFSVGYISYDRSFKTGASSRPAVARMRLRPGRAKASRTRDMTTLMALPRPAEIPVWLAEVRNRRGYAKYLACRMILETGVRLNEVVNLKVHQIPNQEILDHLSRRGDEFATMHLVETKGDQPRDIDVPLNLLIEIKTWIETKRSTYATRHRQRVGTRPGDALFLSDAKGYEGIPIKGHTIYGVFRDIHRKPFRWHPHFGRHTYACYRILFAIEQEAKQQKLSFEKLGADWILLRGQFHLNLLRNQLGHLDEKTTALYLRWLTTVAGVADISAEWHHFLAGDRIRSEEESHK